jgi:hypothetical protein
LVGAADAFADQNLHRRTWALADDALWRLGTGGILRSHPGEDRYEAVDVIGILLLSLYRLHVGREPDLMGWWL